jgi:hypothetical protein
MSYMNINIFKACAINASTGIASAFPDTLSKVLNRSSLFSIVNFIGFTSRKLNSLTVLFLRTTYLFTFERARCLCCCYTTKQKRNLSVRFLTTGLKPRCLRKRFLSPKKINGTGENRTPITALKVRCSAILLRSLIIQLT